MKKTYKNVVLAILIFIVVIVVGDLVHTLYMKYKYIPEYVGDKNQIDTLNFSEYYIEDTNISLFYPNEWSVEDNNIVFGSGVPVGSITINIFDLENTKIPNLLSTRLNFGYSKLFGYPNGTLDKHLSFYEKLNGNKVLTVYEEVSYDQSKTLVKTMGYDIKNNDKNISILICVYDDERYSDEEYFDIISRSIFFN